MACVLTSVRRRLFQYRSTTKPVRRPILPPGRRTPAPGMSASAPAHSSSPKSISTLLRSVRSLIYRVEGIYFRNASASRLIGTNGERKKEDLPMNIGHAAAKLTRVCTSHAKDGNKTTTNVGSSDDGRCCVRSVHIQQSSKQEYSTLDRDASEHFDIRISVLNPSYFVQKHHAMYEAVSIDYVMRHAGSLRCGIPVPV